MTSLDTFISPLWIFSSFLFCQQIDHRVWCIYHNGGNVFIREDIKNLKQKQKQTVHSCTLLTFTKDINGHQAGNLLLNYFQCDTAPQSYKKWCIIIAPYHTVGLSDKHTTCLEHITVITAPLGTIRGCILICTMISTVMRRNPVIATKFMIKESINIHQGDDLYLVTVKSHECYGISNYWELDCLFINMFTGNKKRLYWWIYRTISPHCENCFNEMSWSSANTLMYVIPGNRKLQRWSLSSLALSWNSSDYNDTIPVESYVATK